MSSFDAAPSHTFRNFILFLILCALVLGGFALARGGAPAIDAQNFPPAVGIRRQISITVRQSMGIRSIKASYEQNGKQFPVADKEYGGRSWFFAGKDPKSVTLALGIGRRDVPGLVDGPAKFVLEATDANLRGSTAHFEQAITVSSVPPQVAVLSSQHYIVQGGAEMVVYSVSKTASRSGVEMAGHFFPGYPLPNAKPGILFSFYAFPYNAPADAQPEVIAEDAAGNRVTANIPGKTFPATYPARPIPIDDGFISHVVMTIIANMPELSAHQDPLQNFLMVNRDLRRTETQQLVDISSKTEPKFLWQGAFVQMPNSQVEAHFADHRMYMYHGQQVDDEFHLGYDLASIKHAPIPAANSGRVVWAKYFGIYGNCVLIDHGYGLMSLYGHMNDFMVKAGDTVQKGQIIGHTDTTGLAGGDHLHFSMLLDGVQVDPKEWWDAHWIQVHINQKEQEFAPAAAAAQPAPAAPVQP